MFSFFCFISKKIKKFFENIIKSLKKHYSSTNIPYAVLVCLSPKIKKKFTMKLYYQIFVVDLC